jgi:UDP-2,3-diacylglucosamine hydrolase
MPEGAAPPAVAPAAAPGGLPAFFSFQIPTVWRAIDFISDLHLCEALPRTFAAWRTYMRHTSADAVFILGDLFEVWVGDDARFRPFERQVLDVLAECASHRQVAFMVGNRDFLVGTALLRDGGLMGLPDPTLIGAWGQPILLSHGDALCLSDEPYQAFRREVRSTAWQAAFLARPLAERLRIAAEIRQVSASRKRFDGDSGADVDHGAAVHWMHAMGSAEMVHGHTHRPGSDALAPGFKRHVLSDWDLDQGRRAEVLRLSRGGFERRVPEGV